MEEAVSRLPSSDTVFLCTLIGEVVEIKISKRLRISVYKVLSLDRVSCNDSVPKSLTYILNPIVRNPSLKILLLICLVVPSPKDGSNGSLTKIIKKRAYNWMFAITTWSLEAIYSNFNLTA